MVVKTDFLKLNSTVFIEKQLHSSSFDGVILITYPNNVNVKAPKDLQAVVDEALTLDKGLQTEVSLLRCPKVAGSRLIISPTGPISPYDDVRSVYEAAQRGISRAVKAGIKSPIVVVQNVPKFKRNALVLLLGIFETLYVPIQVRENTSKKEMSVTKIGVYSEDATVNLDSLVQNALALEHGRIIARDVAGADPERMCPPNVEIYMKEQFKDHANVKIEVISDLKTIEKEFPLFAAVNRAANEIERHRGRIIFLTYTPSDMSKVKDTVILVGKGVTYDTGGADIKAGGHMAGMSRDKSGAAAVAGFLKTCALLNPTNVKVVGIMSMVRNSVGENCYVSDELLVSRSGKLIRIGNTDAEGRMVMADLVCMMKDKAKTEVNPHIYTIATLTGHAIKAFGEGYAAIVDNYVARDENHGKKLQESGEIMGDMFEVSSMRREDLATHRGTFRGDDVLQSRTEPSVAVERGHQGPAAFILIASGLEEENIKFSHIDMAPSAGIAPKEPTASPMLALAQYYQILL